MNVPALSFHKPERQGQGSLVSKIRKKGWASPPQKIPAQAELGRATPGSRNARDGLGHPPNVLRCSVRGVKALDDLRD